jgi:hypothetical protein
MIPSWFSQANVPSVLVELLIAVLSLCAEKRVSSHKR